MQLTSNYSRVAAPHDENCPYPDCGKMVKDWFIEWYPKDIQNKIGHKILAMDCPWCRRPASPKGLRIVIPDPPLVAQVRDYATATTYAKTQFPSTGNIPYSSLEDFLSDYDNAEKAAPYKQGYWTQVNIP